MGIFLNVVDLYNCVTVKRSSWVLKWIVGVVSVRRTVKEPEMLRVGSFTGYISDSLV